MDTIKLRFKDRQEFAKVRNQLIDNIHDKANWQLIVERASKQTDAHWDEIIDEAADHFSINAWDFDEKTNDIVMDCVVSVIYHQWFEKAIDAISDGMLVDGLEAISELQNNDIVKNWHQLRQNCHSWAGGEWPASLWEPVFCTPALYA